MDSGEADQSPRFPPYAGLAIAVLSVSFAAPLFRLADAPPLTASFWRLAVAVALLFFFIDRSRWAAFTSRDWKLVIGSGLALGLHFGLWVTSLFYTTVAASVSLVTLQGVFVAIGSHFLLGEKLAKRAWIGVAIATVGASGIAALDAGAQDHRALLGDLLAFLGGLGSAAYMLIGRRLRQRHDTLTYAVPVYAVAAISLLPAMLLLGQPISPGSSSNFIWFVLLAAVPMIGGHTLVNWCIKYIPASTAATWILLEPAGSTLLAWPLLGEVPHLITVAGGVLVLIGAYLVTSRRESRASHQ